MKAMEVQLQFGGITDAVKGLREVAGAWKEVAQAQAQAGAGTARVGNVARGAAAAGGGGGRSSRGAAGPMEKLRQAEARLQAAQASGDEERIFDAQVAHVRAQRAVKRGQEMLQDPGSNDFFQSIKGLQSTLELLRSSLPHGIAEALGHVLTLVQGGQAAKSATQALPGSLAQAGGAAANATQAAGGAAEATVAMEGVAGAAGGLAPLLAALSNPITAVIAVVVALLVAFKAFLDVIEKAAKRINEIGEAVRTSGGTSREVSTLNAYGIQAGEIPGMAGSLRDKLTNDPLGMVAGSKLGIGAQLPRAYGPQNEAKLLLAAADGLAKITNAEERLRTARMLGIEPLLKIADLSEGTRKRLQNDAALLGRIVDPATSKAANEFQTAMGRVGFNFQSLMAAFSKPVFKLLTPLVNMFADTLGELASLFEENQGAILPLIQPFIALGVVFVNMLLVVRGIIFVFDKLGDFLRWLGEIVIGFIGKITHTTEALKKAGLIKDPKKEEDERKKEAEERHTRALEENTRALREGMHNAGERGMAALGGGWKGAYIGRNLETQALKFGAFGL